MTERIIAKFDNGSHDPPTIVRIVAPAQDLVLSFGAHHVPIGKDDIATLARILASTNVVQENRPERNLDGAP